MLNIQTAPSPNFNERRGGGPVDTIVLHYTGMKSATESLARMCDPAAEVSAHYLIEEDGAVIRLVEEDKRAWHAGRGFWRGETDINSRSVGIEIQNPGHEHGYVDFPEAQIGALILLMQGIFQRHPIDLRKVIAHSDLAPLRKTDPGEKFPWPRLKADGLCLYPEPGGLSQTGNLPTKTENALQAEILENLAAIGYEIDPIQEPGTGKNHAALVAFQRRFRPEAVNGEPDDETRRLLIETAALHR